MFIGSQSPLPSLKQSLRFIKSIFISYFQHDCFLSCCGLRIATDWATKTVVFGRNVECPRTNPRVWLP